MRKRAITRQCGQGDEVCSRGPQEGSAPGSRPRVAVLVPGKAFQRKCSPHGRFGVCIFFNGEALLSACYEHRLP